MKSGDFIFARTHADFINKLLNFNLKGYMKCTYELEKHKFIWLIRLNGKQSKEGFTNYINGNCLYETYTGEPKLRYESHKILDKQSTRLIFDIIENPNMLRKYIFRGVYVFDSVNGTNDKRIWLKISDEYNF